MSKIRSSFLLCLTCLFVAGLVPQARVEAAEAPAFDTPPRLVESIDPKYPERARKAGAEGKVLVQLIVDAEGAVVDAELIQGVEGWPEFAAAALAVLPTWRFEAATLDGESVEAQVAVPVSFKLDKRKGERRSLNKPE